VNHESRAKTCYVWLAEPPSSALVHLNRLVIVAVPRASEIRIYAFKYEYIHVFHSVRVSDSIVFTVFTVYSHLTYTQDGPILVTLTSCWLLDTIGMRAVVCAFTSASLQCTVLVNDCRAQMSLSAAASSNLMGVNCFHQADVRRAATLLSHECIEQAFGPYVWLVRACTPSRPKHSPQLRTQARHSPRRLGRHVDKLKPSDTTVYRGSACCRSATGPRLRICARNSMQSGSMNPQVRN
jgi:hypothetical protein